MSQQQATGVLEFAAVLVTTFGLMMAAASLAALAAPTARLID